MLSIVDNCLCAYLQDMFCIQTSDRVNRQRYNSKLFPEITIAVVRFMRCILWNRRMRAVPLNITVNAVLVWFKKYRRVSVNGFLQHSPYSKAVDCNGICFERVRSLVQRRSCFRDLKKSRFQSAGLIYRELMLKQSSATTE